MNILKNARWQALAADLGASSGKVFAGAFDGQRLGLQDVHRFENEPVHVLGTLHWDILRLLHEIKTGLRKGHGVLGAVASAGIDTWGVDFGLLDKAGRLLGNPVHYRDHRTDGVMERVLKRIPREEVFRRSGIQFMPINTIWQLAALKEKAPELLEDAHALLLIPDLLAYFLTGRKAAEYTNATTTQLVDAASRTWSAPLLEKLALPQHLFMPLTQPGTVLGPLASEVSDELNGLRLQVITVATHDTASAVVATPARDKHFAYISCGTWSLCGTEVSQPVLTPRAQELNFTNEGGAGGTYRLLKNIMGLWLLQETKRAWERSGRQLGWPEMTRLAAQAKPLVSLIDPDDGRFLAAGDMPARIRAFCQETGQPVPQDDGALLRCVTESLALKYRHAIERLEELTGHRIEAIHMVGGGIQNELLCRFAANASGRTVLAGPVEATALGNLAVQLIAAKEAASVAETREIVARSAGLKEYTPADTAAWNDAYGRFQKLVK